MAKKPTKIADIVEDVVDTGKDILDAAGAIASGDPAAIVRVAIALLEKFQAGAKACEENRVALERLHRALAALDRRIVRRRETGKSGTGAA
jgi:orotate phosphoribosyltransferase